MTSEDTRRVITRTIYSSVWFPFQGLLIFADASECIQTPSVFSNLILPISLPLMKSLNFLHHCHGHEVANHMCSFTKQDTLIWLSSFWMISIDRDYREQREAFKTLNDKLIKESGSKTRLKKKTLAEIIISRGNLCNSITYLEQWGWDIPSRLAVGSRSTSDMLQKQWTCKAYGVRLLNWRCFVIFSTD